MYSMDRKVFLETGLSIVLTHEQIGGAWTAALEIFRGVLYSLSRKQLWAGVE